MSENALPAEQALLPPPSLAARSAYVRAAMLGGFAELVSDAGGDPARLASQVGIPVRALRDPDMVISWTAVGEVMELAARELNKPSLGLEWLRAAPEPLLNVGAIALIARFTDRSATGAFIRETTGTGTPMRRMPNCWSRSPASC